MSSIIADPKARQRSIERMAEAAAPPDGINLNHGLRTNQELNDHLRREPLERIDRAALVEAAVKAFSGTEN